MKKSKKQEITPEEKLKYEIAEELGLLDKVQEYGWRNLTARESGRIGGRMTQRRRMQKRAADTDDQGPAAPEEKA